MPHWLKVSSAPPACHQGQVQKTGVLGAHSVLWKSCFFPSFPKGDAGASGNKLRNDYNVAILWAFLKQQPAPLATTTHPGSPAWIMSHSLTVSCVPRRTAQKTAVLRAHSVLWRIVFSANFLGKLDPENATNWPLWGLPQGTAGTAHPVSFQQLTMHSGGFEK